MCDEHLEELLAYGLASVKGEDIEHENFDLEPYRLEACSLLSEYKGH